MGHSAIKYNTGEDDHLWENLWYLPVWSSAPFIQVFTE